MNRSEKRDFVKDFAAVARDADMFVVVHYAGLKVNELETLRSAAHQAQISFRVAKNALVKRAVAETPIALIDDLLSGPTAFAWGEDPVAVARILVDFAKDNEKFVVLGGVAAAKPLRPEDIKAYAELPSLDSLRAKLIGLLAAPAQKIVGLTQAPAAQLARLLAAHSQNAEKDQPRHR